MTPRRKTAQEILRMGKIPLQRHVARLQALLAEREAKAAAYDHTITADHFKAQAAAALHDQREVYALTKGASAPLNTRPVVPKV